ncbi:MAG TPA: pyridoxamine 5'-phosphate oxidase [Phycisphaerales bacterium]|nr:pyridoxamine 5'-phosphate oxidase [Phycisphaerales bacterium]
MKNAAQSGIPASPQTVGSFDQSDLPAALPGDLSDPLPADPFAVFAQWFDRAARERIQPNPNAMTVALVGENGHPSARILLCKSIDPASGHIVFFTNYRSRKGREISANPWASVVFHWDILDRQVRLEGPIVKCPAPESDAYFATRPLLSRIGAWASDQSEPIATRAALEAKVDATLRRFGLDPANLPPPSQQVHIPRPPHWGGFRLYAQRLELWCAGAGRLHDRAAWTRDLRPTSDGFTAGPWRGGRLQP